MQNRIRRRCCIGLMAVAVSGLAQGQIGRRLELQSERSVVTLVRVKPEKLSEWLDLQRKSVVPALRKAGVKTRVVYTSGVFGKAFQYTIIQPMGTFADFDSSEAQAEALGAVADAGLTQRLRKCVAETSSFLSTVLPELSNPGTVKNPVLVGFVRLRVTPGKMQAYQDLFKAEALPALRKANANVVVASRRLGTDGYDLTFETPLTKFAELDAPPPLLVALGKEGAAQLTAKLADYATVMENTVLIRQQDLSF